MLDSKTKKYTGVYLTFHLILNGYKLNSVIRHT